MSADSTEEGVHLDIDSLSLFAPDTALLSFKAEGKIKTMIGKFQVLPTEVRRDAVRDTETEDAKKDGLMYHKPGKVSAHLRVRLFEMEDV